jgi:hypothetical protein
VLEENTLSDRERLGLRVLCTISSASSGERLHTCEYCLHPERRIARRIEPIQKRRLIREAKRSRGCIGKGARNTPHPYGSAYQLTDGTRFWTCPRLFEQDLGLLSYMQTYLWYEHQGTLPVAGGLGDQPAKWVQAMEVIRSEFRRIERHKAEAERKRAERMRNKNTPARRRLR